MHCIDATDPTPYETYLTVRREFEEYDPTLLEKDEIILLTKIDLVTPEQIKTNLTALKKTKKKILTVSIYNEESIAALQKTIHSLL
jgi:GTP-binding protein